MQGSIMTWTAVRRHADKQLDDYALEMFRKRIPQRLEQFLFDRTGKRRELGQRQCTPTDARHRLLDLAADERSELAGTSAHRLGRLVEHAKDWDLIPRPLRVEHERERALERRQCELVGPQCPLQRVPPQSFERPRKSRPRGFVPGGDKGE
jgi:hypothetical protein